MKFLTIPVFPLNGSILLPGSNLPLNIFEKRYISMVDYALSNKKCIGMIQSKENNDQLYKIGCVGKITNFNETGDGRYIINLFGIEKFEIIEEISTSQLFRLFNVKVNNKQPIKKLNPKEFDKNELLKKFNLFFEENKLALSSKEIDKVDTLSLINLLAMICPFSASEKQMLLESKNPSDLAKNLMALLDFHNSNNNYKGKIN